MVAADFDAYWRSAYPEAPPLGYVLRTTYPYRWLRVHSLPDAQRYPGNEEDWRELLARQRALFADLVGDPADGVLVTGDYVFGVAPGAAPPAEPLAAEGALQGLPWASLPPVPMNSLPPDPHVPDEDGSGEWYRPACAPYRWTAATGEGLLRDIAQGNVQAFFVSVAHACILSPYDGGVDLIFPDEKARNQFRDQHAAWLSPRADGL